MSIKISVIYQKNKMKKFIRIITIFFIFSSCQKMNKTKEYDYKENKKDPNISMKSTSSGIEIKN